MSVRQLQAAVIDNNRLRNCFRQQSAWTGSVASRASSNDACACEVGGVAGAALSAKNSEHRGTCYYANRFSFLWSMGFNDAVFVSTWQPLVESRFKKGQEIDP
jgi:hypothetical protein